MSGALGTLRSLAALTADAVVAVAHVIVEHGQDFNEAEAAEFLASGSQYKYGGAGAAPTISAAGVAAEPRSTSVESPSPPAPGVDQRLYNDPAYLLREAATALLTSAEFIIAAEASDYRRQLSAALGDLAAQFAADQLTP